MNDLIVDVYALLASFDRYREVQKIRQMSDDGDGRDLLQELNSLRREIKGHLPSIGSWSNSSAFLYRFCSNLKYLPLVAVCYADPPYSRSRTRRGEIITRPHSWASDAVDRAIWNTENDDNGGLIIDAAWDEVGGLAIVFRTTFGEILDSVGLSRQVGVRRTSICAHLEYFNQSSARSEPGPSGVVLTGFSMMRGAGGCNPGGLLYFPEAPRFSAILKRVRYSLHLSGEYDTRRARSREEITTCTQQFVSAPKMNQVRVRALFPNQKWGNNRALELLVEGTEVEVSDSIVITSQDAMFGPKEGW